MKLSDNNQPSSAPVGGEATVVQSVPTGDGIDIATMVKSDIEARALKGERTYGTRLKSGNGRDGLIDAYQEALDLALYLRQELEDRRRITQPDTAQEECGSCGNPVSYCACDGPPTLPPPDTEAKWSHFAADVLADDSFSKYWNGLDADTRNGLLAILQPVNGDREAKARKVAEDIMDEYWFDDGLHVSSREKALSAITAALLQFSGKDL